MYQRDHLKQPTPLECKGEGEGKGESMHAKQLKFAGKLFLAPESV